MVYNNKQKMHAEHSLTPALPGVTRRVWLLAAVAYLLLHLAWLVWGREDAWERLWLGGTTTLVSLLLAVFLAVEAARGAQPEALRAWRWLVIGLGLRALAEGVRFVLGLFWPGLAWNVSWSAWLYLPVAGCAALAVVLFPLPPRGNVSRLRLMLDGLLTAGAWISLLWLLGLRPRLSLAPWWVIAAAQLDWLVVLLWFQRFLLADAGRFPGSFVALGLGWLVLPFGDQAFLDSQGYQPGAPLDWVWSMGYLFLGGAGVWAMPVLQSWRASSRWQRTWRYWRARLQNLLPILLTLLLGWSVLVLWQLAGNFDSLALWATFALTLGLIIRQGLVFGESEFHQYAGLVNSIAEPTFICDRRGFLRLVNPAFCRAVGLEHERDILGESLLNWFAPAETLASWLQRAFEGEDEVENAWAGETHLLRKDGERIPVYLSLRTIASGERERLALAGAVHDLSLQKAQQAALQAALEQIAADRAQLERLNAELEQRVAEKTADLSAAYARLEAQNRALRELDRLKSEFVSLVSHELRAPLTNIKGGLELVLRKPQALPATTRQRLELVQAEIERLARFVETILDLSALEAGRMPLYPAPVLLSGVVARLQRQLAHHPQAERIVWKIPPDLPPLLADEQALGSILFHLLDNALKYAPHGEISVEVAVENEHAVLRVMDEGPGIPEQALPFLFEQFYRVDSRDAREIYGHGLGLYIVRRLVEAMNGETWAENRPEGGACFACRLPLAEVNPPLTSARSGEGEYEGQDPGRG